MVRRALGCVVWDAFCHLFLQAGSSEEVAGNAEDQINLSPPGAKSENRVLFASNVGAWLLISYVLRRRVDTVGRSRFASALEGDRFIYCM